MFSLSFYPKKSKQSGSPVFWEAIFSIFEMGTQRLSRFAVSELAHAHVTKVHEVKALTICLQVLLAFNLNFMQFFEFLEHENQAFFHQYLPLPKVFR